MGWMICLALGLITLAVYWPSLSHQFLGFDDQQYVTENPSVRAGLSLQGARWAFTTFHASNWHPLTWLSHMLDWQIYGGNPMGHHLTNVLLHLANTLLLFVALFRLSGALWRSACVAALFAWHPLHVESVAWIAERKDVLSTFFFLLTLLAYTGYVRASEQGRGVARWYGTALGCFALGLLSKPMVVTLPFVLLLLDYWPLARFRSAGIWKLLREKLPFILLSGIACSLTLAAQHQGFTVVSRAGLPLSQRLPHVLVAYGHYLEVTFLPRQLAAYYPYVREMGWWQLSWAGLVLISITGLAVRFARSRPYLLIGWLWYLGTLVPVIGLVQVGDQAWADRYTYIPLIGVFIAVVWGAADLGSRWASRSAGARMALGALAAAACVVLLVASARQLRHWSDTRALFEHAAAVTQRNARALTVLGSLDAAEGKVDSAKRRYAEALSYDPDNPETHFYLGKLHDQAGDLDSALAAYDGALWARQWRERALVAMGADFARQTNYTEAIARYQAALAVEPKSATAHNNLARLFHSQGRYEEAIRHYEAALEINPGLAPAHNNLGVLLLQQGRAAEGIRQLREAARLNPADPETQFNLAVAWNQQQHWNEAAAILAAIAPGRPNDPKLHYEYGRALEHLEKPREALSHYAKALLLMPDYPEALTELSWLLSTSPSAEFRNGPEALAMAQRACELTGNKIPAALLSLAAANAETGNFSEATRLAQIARESAQRNGQKEAGEKAAQMLEAFKSAKEWREQPTARSPEPSNSR
jgi:tetratricopeptide (TPR) repeat protein